MKKVFGFIGLILLGGAPSLAQESQTWSRFRGPNGEGKGPLVNFASKPTMENSLLWKTEIPGDGNGSPVIWGKTIYLQSSGNNGVGRTLVAVEAINGKILWSADLIGAKSKTHAKNSLASSTPACATEGIFSVFWNGENLLCTGHSHQGNLLWTSDLGPFKSQHGAGHSPIFHEGKVFVNFDQDNKAEVVALNAKDGKISWRTPRTAYRSSYSTPILRKTASGKTEIVVASTAGFAGYDPNNGKEIWSIPTIPGKNALRMVSSPIFLPGDLIFGGGGDGSGERQALAVPVGKSGAKPAWQDFKAFPYVTTSLALESGIFSITDNGFMTTHNPATGEQISHVRLGGAFSSSPILAGTNLIIAVSEAGDIHLIDSKDPKIKPKTLALGEPVFATPALHNGLLLVKGRKTLFCFGQPIILIEGELR